MALLRFFLLCYFVEACQGVLSLVATPSSLHPPNDSQLDLSCSLTPGTSDVSRVMVMQLVKVEGNQRIPLASVLNGEDARFNTDFTGQEAKVDGKISPFRRTDAFLQLTMEKPDDANAGKYVCVMSFLDHTSLLQRQESTAFVTSPTHPTPGPTGADPLGPEQQGSNLVPLLLEQVQTLRNQVANLTQQTHSLPVCSSGKVAFSAQPSSQKTFGAHHTLIFDKVAVNLGQAYDSITGCFLVPRNGLYLVMASLSATYGKTLVDLQVNGQSKAQLAANGNDQTSVSLVLQLRTKDLVCLQGIYASRQ